MADDIDIEEHDVLDNPRIKNIFPDITTIKTEVEDYDEEANTLDEDEDGFHHPQNRTFKIDFEESNDYMTFRNKIIVGTKPSTSQNTTQNITEQTNFHNKVIVGSKAGTPDNPEENDSEDDSEDGVEIMESSVTLKDLKEFLINNPCYCKPCEILFPTENALDSHKMAAHSFLVAVGNNRAIKSTAKSSFGARIKLEPPASDRMDLICNHCNEVFPNEIALIKHTYELLPGNFECDVCDLVFENDAAYRAHKSTHSSSDLFIQCHICTCHFKLASKLGTHMRLNHQITDVGNVKHVKTNFECTLCGSQLKDSKYYNMHIQSCHQQLYSKTMVTEKTPKFKCPQCNLRFSSEYSVRIHRAAKHGFVDQTNSSNSQNNAPKPTALVQKSHTQSLRFNKCRPLPMSTIYKCDKCQIHFMSCISALVHSRRCILKKGEWKCHQCRRSFKLTDRLYHSNQHEMAEKFKIIEISDSVLNRILCRCRSCMVCFDERTILNCHSENCSRETSPVQCVTCHIWLHPKSLSAHKKSHAEGLTINDFIIVDYVHSGLPKSKENPPIVSINKDTKGVQKTYFHCPTCKCFMQRNRHVDGHHLGKCNKDLHKYTCKLCGLRFTIKGSKSHKMLHKIYPKLKLRDLRFVDAQNDKCISPPFPDFKKCEHCNVRFFSRLALNNHVCNSEEPKICMHCGESFSDLAYNLHVPFHEYTAKNNATITENIPELIKKYESLKQVWNILFLCQTCNIVIDAYDKVVEHCQDHFRNMESYNVTIDHCNVCDLNFVDDSYKRHEELHLSDHVNKSSFTILEYKYDTLHSDSWLDVFVTLTKEQVDLILSKSMYKFTRCVRMKQVTDGPLDLTLYQCDVCELIVPVNKIVEHAQNQSSGCVDSTSEFNCSTCGLSFAANNHKNSHENLHEGRRIDDKSFRIIRFIAERQYNAKDAPSSDQPAELKFIRCQHCGKLINKQKYKAHIKYHNYYNKAKAKRKGVNLPPEKLRTHPVGTTFVHNFYKCRDCNLCISKKGISTHYCVFDMPKKKCTKCLLWFRSQNIASHHKYHGRYSFDRNNINVTYFENGVIDKKPLPNPTPLAGGKVSVKGTTKECKVVFYQCTNCTMCIMKKPNVKNHVCSPSTHRATCDLCGLTVYASHLPAHKYFHEIKTFSRKSVVVYKFNNAKPSVQKREIKSVDKTIVKRKRTSSLLYNGVPSKKAKPTENQDVPTNHEETNEIELKSIKNKPSVEKEVNSEFNDKDFFRHIHIRYFKCKECKLLFVTCSSLIAHATFCYKDRNGVKCNVCGLVFHSSMIQKHKMYQKCKADKSYQLCLVTAKTIGKSPQEDDNWVYSCHKCDTYSVSFRALTYHIDVGHKHGRKIVTCNKCDIKFTSRAYITHVSIHHRDPTMSIADLSVAIVEDTVLENALMDLPNEDDVKILMSDSFDSAEVIQISENNDSENVDSENVDSENIDSENNDAIVSMNKDHEVAKLVAGIYNCDICGLNFVNSRSLSAHKSYGRHDEVQYSCSECGLSFTQISLKRHALIHHPKTHKRKENSKGKIEKKTNDAMELSKVTVENSVDHKTIASSSNLDQNDSVLEGISAIFVEPNIVVKQNELAAQTMNQNKLFKCSICDVYYPNANACQEHTSEHTALDPTEYIACKMCDLQFPCEHLGKHMKGHRDGTFCVDDLMVAEYQIGDDGKVCIETYSAADRLKSKLVTTTTHSDTEDDKDNGGVNCVDSTTESVPCIFGNGVAMESISGFEADTASSGTG